MIGISKLSQDRKRNWATKTCWNSYQEGLAASVKVKSLSRVRVFATPWKVTYEAPRSVGFSRQDYWSGLPFPSPGDSPNPEIKPRSPALQTGALPSEPPGKPKFYKYYTVHVRDWASMDFGIFKGPRTHPPWIQRDKCIHMVPAMTYSFHLWDFFSP